MRQRVEDLGRIAVMLKHIVDDELFEERQPRNKEYYEWFCQQSEDKQDDIVRMWVYGLDKIQEKIYEVMEIANGEDYLNQPRDE